ncbi:McrB family protein [Mucilaginibacter sp. NFR10]|uniref:McrB family protein n=1 Tax=Mucilaginibacter sp. NFR10 TaxID=1566292 RepID=UPI0008711B7C|nr:AAA family ATPase [Mucilaginibacter sp. NFR10]SCW38328.1 5-methylcytosine-specific restriction enzyme B [Mucilaginibacter sp. NFR10]
MPFEPEKITKEHIIKATKILDSGEIGIRPSIKFDVIVNGKAYPPKDLMRLAHEEATGEYLWQPGGGEPTNRYLTKLGFEIREKNNSADPIANLVKIYKDRVKASGNADEVYKFDLITDFQNKWDIDAPDFFGMFKQINFSNLLFFNAIGVIREVAARYPEEVREAFRVLYYDEIILTERIKRFQTAISDIYARLKNLNHNQDERTIATYLTFHNASIYTYYKSSFYSKYCKLLNIKKAKAGDRYIHYLELVDQLIENYIDEDEELKQMHAKYLENSSFKDEKFKILAQDILYQSLDLAQPEVVNYYIGGSVWQDAKPADQLTRFLKDGIWENGYDGKNLDLVKSIKPSSKIAIKAVHTIEKTKSVMTIKARGEVVENEDDGNVLKVNWEEGFKPFVVNFSGGYWQTIHSVTNPEHIDAIFNNSAQKQYPVQASEEHLFMSNAPLNQILFGPPGTGKTYHTMNKALEIVGINTASLDRNGIKAEYEKRVAAGQFVFTTFHQSMSYEDFIEGIKPNAETDEGGQIRYKIEDGILKRLSRKAVAEYYRQDISNKKQNSTPIDRLQLYDEAWDHLVKSVQENLDNGKTLELSSSSGKTLDAIKITAQGNILVKPRSENAEEYTVSYTRTQKLFEAYPDLSVVKNIDKEFRQVIGGANATTYWCVVDYLNNWIKQKQNTKAPIAEVIQVNEALVKFDNQIVKDNVKANVKPYVLIIDEINRGNVSKVFGELITLIEKDKRLGHEEAIEVTLPYSKEKFGVPANLYIIGTMNTADRSVEALDTALRRRFSFEEILPNPTLLSPAALYWKLLWDYKDVSWEDENFITKEENLLELLGANDDLWKARKEIWDDMEKEGRDEKQISYFDSYIFSGVSLQQILNTLNKRIEVLKDRDHQIGHAYFINVCNLADLMAVFKDNIIPLLQEYFFGDYNKIQLVLGDGFITSSSTEVKFAIEEDDEYADRIIYSIAREVFETETKFATALERMNITK